jgi:hypothetical protein
VTDTSKTQFVVVLDDFTAAGPFPSEYEAESYYAAWHLHPNRTFYRQPTILRLVPLAPTESELVVPEVEAW